MHCVLSKLKTNGWGVFGDGAGKEKLARGMSFLHHK